MQGHAQWCSPLGLEEKWSIITYLLGNEGLGGGKDSKVCKDSQVFCYCGNLTLIPGFEGQTGNGLELKCKGIMPAPCLRLERP